MFSASPKDLVMVPVSHYILTKIALTKFSAANALKTSVAATKGVSAKSGITAATVASKASVVSRTISAQAANAGALAAAKLQLISHRFSLGRPWLDP